MRCREPVARDLSIHAAAAQIDKLIGFVADLVENPVDMAANVARLDIALRAKKPTCGAISNASRTSLSEACFCGSYVESLSDGVRQNLMGTNAECRVR